MFPIGDSDFNLMKSYKLIIDQVRIILATECRSLLKTAPTRNG